VIVGNATTKTGIYSIAEVSFEPYGSKGIVVSIPDATSIFGASHSYCFVAAGYSWFMNEIPLADFKITDLDGNGLSVIENTRGEFRIEIGVRDGMLCPVQCY